MSKRVGSSAGSSTIPAWASLKEPLRAALKKVEWWLRRFLWMPNFCFCGPTIM